MGKVRTKVIETALEPEKAEKIEQEHKDISIPEDKKAVKKPSAGKAKVRSVRYKSLVGEIDKSKQYPIKEAVEIVKKTAKAGFDSTIEVHVNLNFAKDKTDQIIRTDITLPHQPKAKKETKEKKEKILVFADKEKAEIEKTGAEIGTEDTLKEIEKGKISWDKVVAESYWMPKLAKVAKILGPKGLMPNPKSGTVTDNPLEALKELAAGKGELRTEKMPIIHTNIGKVSQSEKELEENLQALIEKIKSAKPENFKKELIKSVYLSSSMGPSVKVDRSTVS